MRFQQYGKTCQLKIGTADELDDILSLDESLWVATSAPSAAFRCDPRFTAFLDQNNSGRVNSDEVKAAVMWLLSVLSDRSHVEQATDALPLAALNTNLPEGRALQESARRVLEAGGKADSDTISLRDVRGFVDGLSLIHI